jgi:quercetin dioxygenase-like cupin family protein
MITEQQQETASLYVLGALDGREAESFEAELRGNADLRALVVELRRTTDLMAMAAPQVPLPDSLREKVLSRIASETTSVKANVPPLSAALAAMAGLRFEDSAESHGWKPLPIPGAYIKLLSLEKERGYAVLLGKLEPGARYPAHVNAGPEDIFILSGDLVVGERRMAAGDFHHADGGSFHAENYSVDGCTLFAVLTVDDPLVAFAMA